MGERANPAPRLLVVDDEPYMAWLFEQSFGKEYAVLSARQGEEALRLLERQKVDAVMLDLCMPGMGGLETLRELRRLHPHVPVVMMTAYATVKTAVEAIKIGASDYVTKPFDLAEVGRVISAILPPPAAGPGHRFPSILGESQAMQAIYRKMERVAPTDACVMITGETGTGKELVARALHGASRRSDGPFVAINCAALPENLLESELFGYEKGAFTGALARKPGRFELANGGTLLLDEIGDMPLSLQVKLLRVLETGAVEPLGSVKPLKVEFRVMVATHRNLAEMVSKGTFRQDLYFRLAVVPIHLPPLRERTGDLPLLANHLLRVTSERHGKRFLGFSPEALILLDAYGWPGNVRELRNLVEQIIVLWDGGLVEPEQLPQLPGVTAAGSAKEPAGAPLKAAVRHLKADYEQDRILAALKACDGNRTRAAQLLGISRRALQMKLKAVEESIEK